MFKWYLFTMDNFYSIYKEGNMTIQGLCKALDNLIDLAANEDMLTNTEFHQLSNHSRFLTEEVLEIR